MAHPQQLRPGGAGDEGASLYVLVDGLGWELLRAHPFLDDLLVERRRLETILGYSTGAIPTLLTGRLPDDHGHWNLFYRSPETSPFRWTRPLLALPRRVREHRVTRRLVNEVSRRVSGYTGYFSIYNLPLDRLPCFDICETRDIYEPGGLSPSPSLFDHLTEARIPYECFNYHQHKDFEILDLVPRRIRDSDRRIFFIYLSGLDAFLHFHVSDGEGVRAKLAWYEQGLRRIHRAAEERWGRARMFLFSDHGMTRIERTFDLMSEVARLGLSMPGEDLAAFDSTMARFWVSSPGAEARLRAHLEGLGVGRFLDAREMRALGLAFADDRYGRLVFVMEPGVLICPSDMGRIRFDGMHGFDPRCDPHAHAVFLSTEPCEPPVAHLADVLPRLLRDLGLEAGAPAVQAAAG